MNLLIHGLWFSWFIEIQKTMLLTHQQNSGWKKNNTLGHILVNPFLFSPWTCFDFYGKLCCKLSNFTDCKNFWFIHFGLVMIWSKLEHWMESLTCLIPDSCSTRVEQSSDIKKSFISFASFGYGNPASFHLLKQRLRSPKVMKSLFVFVHLAQIFVCFQVVQLGNLIIFSGNLSKLI